MPVSSKPRSRPRVSAPGKSPKTAKHWKSAEELQAMIAERSGEPMSRAVFGEPGNWDATFLVNPSGSAEGKVAVASELRSEYDLALAPGISAARDFHQR